MIIAAAFWVHEKVSEFFPKKFCTPKEKFERKKIYVSHPGRLKRDACCLLPNALLNTGKRLPESEKSACVRYLPYIFPKCPTKFFVTLKLTLSLAPLNCSGIPFSWFLECFILSISVRNFCIVSAPSDIVRNSYSKKPVTGQTTQISQSANCNH